MKNEKKLGRLAHPQMNLSFGDGLVLDYFAGGGGASSGIERALGRPVDIAINHNKIALAMHEVNHPQCDHYTSCVWEIDPRLATKGKPVDLAWFSPDCKHFSRAKGAKPVEKNIRGLAWVKTKVLATVRPAIAITENVPEFLDWGPLINKRDQAGNIIFKDHDPVLIPDPQRKGETFRAWICSLEALGYKVEWRTLKACDYGAPTTRKRLFIVARCDGRPINWPKPTHGKLSGLLAYRTAAECIDWTIPCYSVFLTKEDAKKNNVRRPLATNTLRRIAKGLEKFVINNPNPFIVPRHGDRHGQAPQCNYFEDSKYGNTTSVNNSSIFTACFARQFGKSVGHAADTPMATITAGGGGKTQLLTAFMAKHYTGVYGHVLNNPLGTITAVDHHSLIASHLIKLRGTCRDGQSLNEPLSTITAGGLHVGEIRTLLSKGGEKVTGLINGLTEDQRYMAWWVVRFMEDHSDMCCGDEFISAPRPSAVVVGEYVVVDIGLRMLAPKELFKAQGFDDEYIHDRDKEGNRISATNQVKMCGNSVSPNVASALVESNYPISGNKVEVA